ncbi:HAMP domain-containing histidine kinase [Clostridium estertheticum]|uniref:histidine kinase n=2 Tax=Clostridium estertheticum TaxID=238834 RepID=A0A1J0GG00_9CLOT|nr:HAMP domain-containing sensor histidine kinase [Clostridium estertheticum]APC39822.1 two-component sensor histidine kinase [Clostridium estertheticum subsp. estertheticum]MBU3072702.1 HAMP domain-containing histidine kinase [Clostridium estertheticum]MBU3162795.1 HAMP domain-containing histidine kinase [Clostridium estertheticum]MBU3172012.1 HAMP domain-containing histidine kinase [Clostridium estertheticum]MBZ9614126.1 HAMP domain-containing histidine kinase [Clostridium estertheticum subs
MKKFNYKFKSLTMRIWTTFTAIILIIIFSISIFYLVAFRTITEKGITQDLKVSHAYLLKTNNFTQPNRYDGIKTLKDNDYYIVTVDKNNKAEIINVNKAHGAPPGSPGNVKSPFRLNEKNIKMWMAGYITPGTLYEKKVKESYNNTKFIFFISSIKYGTSGRSYLISYVPEKQDSVLLYTMLGIGVLFIAIGFLCAKLVATYISKPLKELENYTIRISHKDWEEPINVKNEDEIGRLANSMNMMRKELKRGDEEEKLFLQSISHDLKTPIMVIMSHAEAIIDGVYVESVEQNAQIIRDEALRLEKKVKQMLYLNTLDYVLENNFENIEINMQRLLYHITNRFEVVNSNIQWDLNIEEAIITGNADKVQVSIENILDNSLRYAKEKICVTLKKEGIFAVVEIYNDGPNIPEEHLSHIFDNFYKDKTGKFGLGLAICKKIINYYNGEIEVTNRDVGVSFSIKYPL